MSNCYAVGNLPSSLLSVKPLRCFGTGSFTYRTGCLMHEPQSILLWNKYMGKESHFPCDSDLYRNFPCSPLSHRGFLTSCMEAFGLMPQLSIAQVCAATSSAADGRKMLSCPEQAHSQLAEGEI